MTRAAACLLALVLAACATADRGRGEFPHHGEEAEIIALVEPIERKEIDAEQQAMASFLHILAADRQPSSR